MKRELKWLASVIFHESLHVDLQNIAEATYLSGYDLAAKTDYYADYQTDPETRTLEEIRAIARQINYTELFTGEKISNEDRPYIGQIIGYAFFSDELSIAFPNKIIKNILKIKKIFKESLQCEITTLSLISATYFLLLALDNSDKGNTRRNSFYSKLGSLDIDVLNKGSLLAILDKDLASRLLKILNLNNESNDQKVFLEVANDILNIAATEENNNLLETLKRYLGLENLST